MIDAKKKRYERRIELPTPPMTTSRDGQRMFIYSPFDPYETMPIAVYIKKGAWWVKKDDPEERAVTRRMAIQETVERLSYNMNYR